MPREFRRMPEALTPAIHHADIIYFDDFEQLLAWTGSGTGSETVDRSQLAAYTGSYGLRLLTDAAQASGAYAQALNSCIPPVIPKIEFSCHYSHMTNTATADFDFLIEYSDGTNNYLAGIRHNGETGVIEYLDSAGSWQTVTGVTVKLRNDEFIQLKLEIDFNASTKVYGKLTIAGQEADLSAYAVQTVGSSVYNYLQMTLKATSRLNTTAVRLNADNVMVKLI